MGLFDKLKRAFGGGQAEAKPESEEKVVTENPAPQAEVESTPAAVEPATEEKTKADQAEVNQESVETESEPEVEVAAPIPVQPAEVEEKVAPKPAKEVAANEETKRYERGLAKSRKGFGAKINALLANFRSVDEDFFEELEETLIEADVGFETAMKISDQLRDEVKFQNAKKKADVSDVIVEKLVDLYEAEGENEDNQLHFATQGPTVFLFVGVNGVGKTTTIGKLAHRYQAAGKKVLMAAADTFRAGAIEQLVEWGKRVDVEVVRKPEKVIQPRWSLKPSRRLRKKIMTSY